MEAPAPRRIFLNKFKINKLVVTKVTINKNGACLRGRARSQHSPTRTRQIKMCMNYEIQFNDCYRDSSASPAPLIELCSRCC